MGVVFDQAHAMKTVLLNCRTVFIACGLTKFSVLFLHHSDQSYIVLYFSRRIFIYLLVTLLSLHNIIKLHYETF